VHVGQDGSESAVFFDRAEAELGGAVLEPAQQDAVVGVCRAASEALGDMVDFAEEPTAQTVGR
jgi:hypothetical protein